MRGSPMIWPSRPTMGARQIFRPNQVARKDLRACPAQLLRAFVVAPDKAHDLRVYLTRVIAPCW
jgi:hypothetical protein